jgi:glycosyltransferase involved in cell wall biosynthesis
MADDVINGAEPRVLPRTLAGATVLQIARTLADSSEARAVVDVARALVLAGARAIVAAGPGALVEELKSFGGEWAPIAGAVANPIKLSQAAEQLATYIAAERIDIVHAKTLGSVRCARAAAARAIFRLVADLPDWPDLRMRAASLRLGALAGADRIIARSLFLAQPLMRRHGVALERVSVIPRSVDTAYFNPVNLAPQRITALRQSWGIPSGMRIVLVPGRVSPANGQMTLVEAARLLAERGMRDVTFVFAGDDARHRLYVRKIVRRAQAADVYFLFRFVGHRRGEWTVAGEHSGAATHRR